MVENRLYLAGFENVIIFFRCNVFRFKIVFTFYDAMLFKFYNKTFYKLLIMVYELWIKKIYHKFIK